MQSAGLIPPGTTERGLTSLFDVQTQNLNLANSRVDDLVALSDLCKAKQDRLAKDLQPRPWWKLGPR